MYVFTTVIIFSLTFFLLIFLIWHFFFLLGLCSFYISFFLSLSLLFFLRRRHLLFCLVFWKQMRENIFRWLSSFLWHQQNWQNAITIQKHTFNSTQHNSVQLSSTHVGSGSLNTTQRQNIWIKNKENKNHKDKVFIRHLFIQN